MNENECDIKIGGGCQPLKIFEKEMTDLNDKMDKLADQVSHQAEKMDKNFDKLNERIEEMNSVKGAAGQIQQLENDVTLLFFWVKYLGSGLGAIVVAILIKILLK